jgi:hypothetical protein
MRAGAVMIAAKLYDSDGWAQYHHLLRTGVGNFCRGLTPASRLDSFVPELLRSLSFTFEPLRKASSACLRTFSSSNVRHLTMASRIVSSAHMNQRSRNLFRPFVPHCQLAEVLQPGITSLNDSPALVPPHLPAVLMSGGLVIASRRNDCVPLVSQIPSANPPKFSRRFISSNYSLTSFFAGAVLLKR